MTTTDDGFMYGATDEAASFLSALKAPYVGQLMERADWLTSTYMHEGTDVREGMKQITQRWSGRTHVSPGDLGEDDL